MPQHPIDVTYAASDRSRIPDLLTEGACLLVDLHNRGLVAGVGERLHVRRQGGYCGLDGWLVLFVYYASGACCGVKGFWTTLGRHAERLAALAGRSRLPSPSALSRLLERVEYDLLRPVAGWLLAGVAEIDAVLRTYDALGQDWHVFDIDPTVTTLRQRALPEGDDLPEPLRRAEQTGAPGYSGRKRGDLQFRRVTVQHAGSGAWVHAHLSPGNGEGVADLGRALDTIVETSRRLGHPRSRVLGRLDGEYGNVPHITTFQERALPFVTRLNRAALYDDPVVLDRLRTATWYRVPDSGCEPHRAAADLGLVTLAPDRDTRRPDGSTYQPVRVRVVASIFPQTGTASRGRVIDGWQVELFATDLPSDAWPAPDLIALYFARSAEENRFAQEDRELGLDRIVSYHLPGQEFATLVGLAVWNLRLARGFALEPPPDARPVQQLRRPEPDTRVPEHWPRDPKLLELLDQLDWPSLLARHPGWTWDADAHRLRCPDGRPLDLTSVRPNEHAAGRTGIIFRRPKGGCEDCAPREACFQSERHAAPKHAEFSVPTPLASKLRKRLALIRAKAEPATRRVATAPGPQLCRDSLFLPAEARRTCRDCFVGAYVRIDIDLPPPPSPRPRLLAVDVADRQRQRETWTDKVRRYALARGANVRLHVEGPASLRRLLNASSGRRNPDRVSA